MVYLCSNFSMNVEYHVTKFTMVIEQVRIFFIDHLSSYPLTRNKYSLIPWSIVAKRIFSIGEVAKCPSLYKLISYRIS